MAYTPTTWVDGTTPVNAANLNKIETGLDNVDALADVLNTRLTAEEALPDIPTPLVNGKWLSVAGGALVWADAPAGGGGLDYEGAWAAGTAYAQGDVVLYNGVQYGAVNPSTGQVPPPVAPMWGPGSSFGVVAQSIADWNLALQNGYYMSSGGANAPTPTVWYIGEVVTHRDTSPKWLTQRVWDFTAAAQSQVYERRCMNDIWYSWYPIPSGYGTALPSGVGDGYEFTLVDNVTTPTYSWRFRYVSAKATNKWVFVGGAPGFVITTGAGPMTNTTFAALSPAGPTFTIPVTGSYLVEVGFSVLGTSSGGNVIASYTIGAAAAVDADAAYGSAVTSGSYDSSVNALLKSLTGGTVLAHQMRGENANSKSPFNRFLQITPIAVGG